MKRRRKGGLAPAHHEKLPYKYRCPPVPVCRPWRRRSNTLTDLLHKPVAPSG
mgnify:CR=1 FL=1